MSRKHKFYNLEEIYFVSFATINWVDIFVRDQYFWEIAQSLDFCRKREEWKNQWLLLYPIENSSGKHIPSINIEQVRCTNKN